MATSFEPTIDVERAGERMIPGWARKILVFAVDAQGIWYGDCRQPADEAVGEGPGAVRAPGGGASVGR